MKVHEMKVLCDIHHNDDDFEVEGFDWKTQRVASLNFTGFSKPDKKLTFAITFKDGSGDNVIDAFKQIYKEMKETNMDEKIDWEKEFIERIIKLRG